MNIVLDELERKFVIEALQDAADSYTLLAQRHSVVGDGSADYYRKRMRARATLAKVLAVRIETAAE